jgi:hypothetical protein
MSEGALGKRTLKPSEKRRYMEPEGNDNDQDEEQSPPAKKAKKKPVAPSKLLKSSTTNPVAPSKPSKSSMTKPAQQKLSAASFGSANATASTAKKQGPSGPAILAKSVPTKTSTNPPAGREAAPPLQRPRPVIVVDDSDSEVPAEVDDDSDDAAVDEDVNNEPVEELEDKLSTDQNLYDADCEAHLCL